MPLIGSGVWKLDTQSVVLFGEHSYREGKPCWRIYITEGELCDIKSSVPVGRQRHTPLIPGCGRQRQAGLCGLRCAWAKRKSARTGSKATQRNTVSKDKIKIKIKKVCPTSCPLFSMLSVWRPSLWGGVKIYKILILFYYTLRIIANNISLFWLLKTT